MTRLAIGRLRLRLSGLDEGQARALAAGLEPALRERLGSLQPTARTADSLDAGRLKAAPDESGGSLAGRVAGALARKLGSSGGEV